MKTSRGPLEHPLPGRVEPYPDEPPYALLLRTVEHNGFRQPYTTFWRAGLTRGQAVSDLSLERVAFLCQQSVGDISRAAQIVTTMNVTIGGETLYRDQVSVTFRRWCPACLDGRPYHRVWWDVPTVTACPDHGLNIMESCGCRRRPLWHSTPLMGCAKGHRFAQAPRTPAPASEIALSAYVRDRICGNPRAPMPLLDGLDLGEAIRVMERIGRASIGEDVAFSRSKENRGGLAAEGFRIMEKFGPRIHRVFDGLVAASDQREGVRQWGVEHGYGDFYTWIANYPDGSAFAKAIKKAVAAHAARHLVLKTGHKVAGVEVAPQEGLDMTTAAEMCNVSFERFRRIATAIGLVPKTSIRGSPARLDESEVRRWADRIRITKTRQEVAAELGIAPHAVARLIKAGLIAAIVDGQKDQVNRLNIWLLPGDAADRLLARLAAVASPVEERGTLVTIGEAARDARAPLPKLIRLALVGTLPLWRDPKAAELQAFLVSPGDARVVLRRDRVPGMTITEAGKALGLHMDMAAQLRDCGMLKTTTHGRIHSVSNKEFERFKATYVTSEELVSAFKLPPGRWTVVEMRKMGVEPVCDRSKFRQVIYRRDKAVKALARRAAPVEKPAPASDTIDVPDDAIDREDSRRGRRHRSPDDFSSRCRGNPEAARRLTPIRLRARRRLGVPCALRDGVRVLQEGRQERGRRDPAPQEGRRPAAP